MNSSKHVSTSIATESPEALSEVSRLAYILSASHSGSTLLAMLLGCQRGATSVGEIRAPAMGDTETYRCSCGDRIKDCIFWKDVSLRMAQKGIPQFDITNAGTSIFETENHYIARLLRPLPRGRVLELIRSWGLNLSPMWKEHLRQVQERNAALVDVLMQLGSAQIVVDSSKAPLHLKYLLRIPRLSTKVIWLVRDGRAVTLSLLGHGLKRKTRAETIAAAAREWRRSNEAAECVLEGLPRSRWTLIKYEDFCRDPRLVLDRLCDFLELDCSDINLNFRSHQQHILGNEMRLKSNVEVRLDERWRNQLSKQDLDVFDGVAGDLNREYGYE